MAVIVLSGSRWHAATAATLCADAGHAAIVATGRDDVRPAGADALVRLRPLHHTDPAETAAALNACAIGHQAAAIVPAGVAATRWLIMHGPRLDIPCFPTPTLASFRSLRNKAITARRAPAWGLPHPQTTVVSSAGALDVEFPVIVKPALGEGGRLVTRADDAASLASALESILPQTALVQAFVAGRDVDVSVLAVDGDVRVHTVQTRRGGEIKFIEHTDALEVARRLCRTLGYTGLLHLDMRENERELVVIDANPRMWASIDASDRVGVNFIAEGLALLGVSVDRRT